MVYTAPVIVRTENSRTESIQGFLPLQFSSDIYDIDRAGLFYAISAVFCFIALLVVFISCAERYRPHLISLCAMLVFIYSFIHSAFIYMPYQANRVEQGNEITYAVSEYIYNSSDAPPAYIITPSEISVPVLQFMNRNAYIKAAENFAELPDDCFVVVRVCEMNNDEEIVILAETENYIFAAKGERAVAFALSQEIS
jgi:hypothetical protein